MTFRPPSDGGLMIPPETFCRTFVEAIIDLFFFYLLPFLKRTFGAIKFQPVYLNFNYDSLPRVITGYHGLSRVNTG